MTPLPVGVHEFVVAPAAAALALRHAALALGARRAGLEFLALCAYGYALEWVAIAVFASHEYGASWRFAPGGVPLAVAVAWAAVILSALAVATRRGFGSPFAAAGAALLLGVSLDLLMEPVAVRANLWRWTPPGPWLGVPIGNFVGWGVIVGVYAVGAERTRESESLVAQAARRVGLAAASIVVLVGVGFGWQALGAERLFLGRGGFAVFGLVLAATLGLRLARLLPVENGRTLAGRLGDRPVRLASAALLVIAAAFVADAIALGERAVVWTSGLVALTLVTVLPDLLPLSVVGHWRRASFAAMAEVRGLVQVLMKPRNGEPWTDADRAFLRSELKAAARWAPALVLFLLPGSFILLPAYAWVLDRRRGSAREGEVSALR